MAVLIYRCVKFNGDVVYLLRGRLRKVFFRSCTDVREVELPPSVSEDRRRGLLAKDGEVSQLFAAGNLLIAKFPDGAEYICDKF